MKGDKSDINDVSERFTTAQFEAYLDVMINNKKTGKSDGKNINYDSLKEAFKKVKAEELFAMAKNFDTLNIGGKNAKDEYERTLKATT